jgi:lipid-A-disaccharide synthase
MPKVLISAGDASGDLHAAGFARALRARMPDVELLGLGGSAMHDAGVELVADQRDLAIGGLLEIATSLRRIHRAWRAIDAALVHHRPDLVVLVDSGGFNLPLARRVRGRSHARILYYVAPQVWAWRPGRVRKLLGRVDRVAVIHPFEPDFYRRLAVDSGIPVEFVGHPLVDDVARFRTDCDRDEGCRRIGVDPARRWVALLPGSRRNEIGHHLPVMWEAVRRLSSRVRDLGFALAVAPSLDAAWIESRLRALRRPGDPECVVVRGRTRELIRAAEVVIAKPGTATVEAMLLDRPMVVIARAHPVTAAVVRRLLHVPWLAMPNLVAGRAIVPELWQRDARPDRIADSVEALLVQDAATLQRRELAAAAVRLGGGGAAERASAIAEELLVAAAR